MDCVLSLVDGIRSSDAHGQGSTVIVNDLMVPSGRVRVASPLHALPVGRNLRFILPLSSMKIVLLVTKLWIIEVTPPEETLRRLIIPGERMSWSIVIDTGQPIGLFAPSCNLTLMPGSDSATILCVVLIVVYRFLGERGSV